MPLMSSTHRQGVALEYQMRINEVIQYIEANLSEELLLEDLAIRAGFSPFHFHRIFSAFVGEPFGQYIKRRRLIRAGREILETGREVTGIALDAGYETPAAFSKAFKNYFEITPSQLRKEKAVRSIAFATLLEKKPPSYHRRTAVEAEIRTLSAQKIYYVRRYAAVDDQSVHNQSTQAAQSAFAALMAYLHEHKFMDQIQACVGIMPDEPGVTPPEEVRFDAGVIFREEIHLIQDGEIRSQIIPGGRWAVFLHEGPYSTLWQTWNAAFRDWLPLSGERLRDIAPFEKYLNDVAQTPEAELLTEIFIPIE
jgi:AraC family transcriptional regulator